MDPQNGRKFRLKRKPTTQTANNYDEMNRQPSHISLQRVNQLLAKQNDEILLGLLNATFNLNEYLDATRMGIDLVNSFAELISKAFSCNALRTQLNKLAGPVAQSNFLNKVIYSCIEQKSAKNEYNVNLIRLSMKIISAILEVDAEAFKKTEALKDRIELVILVRIKQKALTEEFEEFTRNIDKLALKRLEGEKARTARAHNQITIDAADAIPPENFIQMSVVPKLNDIINDSKPFLRKNVTNGAYKNVSHYLDVQFRLLREDFLSPLREGVFDLQRILKQYGLSNKKYLLDLPKEVTKKIYSIDSLHVYTNVRVIDYEYTSEGVVYSIKIHDLKNINWERSKRLMFGSLLCFSSDSFKQSCIVGFVCNRDVKMLKSGIILVRFDYEIGAVIGENLPNFDDTYVMLETAAFFESYRHVLDALITFERLGENNFPFKEQLVYCQNANISRPRYLNDQNIDFRPLIDFKKVIKASRNGDLGYEFNAASQYAASCASYNHATWPTAQQMKLNNSQYDAIKLALTSRLTLIQGPPGTGKTFVGVKIVQLLLHNKHLWWNPEQGNRVRARAAPIRHKPILMICYTNHALDQFLEYCIKECGLNDGVIRVGGQSKNESLNKFLLKNIKLAKSRTVEKDIFFRIKDERKRLQDLKKQIDSCKSLIDCQKKGLLKANILNLFLNNKGGNAVIFEDDLAVLKWLGLLENNSSTYVNQAANQLADLMNNRLNLNDESDLSQSDSDILDDDFEDYLQDETNERMLDDDIEFQARSSNNKITKEQFLQQTAFERHSNLLDVETISEMIAKSRLGDGWNISRRKKKKFFITQEELSHINDLVLILNNYDHIFSEKNLTVYQKMISNGELNIWTMRIEKRHKLYQILSQKFLNEQQSQLETLQVSFNECAQSLKELRLQEDRAVLQTGMIIAMTTTGAARYHQVLRDIGPRIVIVEEAAEVFEAHIVSALSKDCEHLILIGDHVQLRPNPTVYSLALNYEIDVSLFERLMKNNIKNVMLKCQHRMRPEISRLMAHFYQNNISDDESVHTYPSVKGLNKNIYFIDHRNLEAASNEDKSKSNRFEADYMAKMSDYLCRQQYEQSKITVLTMYLGQLVEIRKRLKALKLDGVKVSTVDNFQGEENDIILLSLVRSNEKNVIGFLGIENRICVALSRARHGLYCIGNFGMLKNVNEKWRNIIHSMEENGCCGNELMLTCGKHPENDQLALTPQDFDNRPSGGCQLRCNFRLKCGHVCRLFCHIYDSNHKQYKCQSICNEVIAKCGHYCQRQCGHSGTCAENCLTLVEKIVPECGHTIKIGCSKIPTIQDCKQKCGKELKCGHKCLKLCSQVCEPCVANLSIDSICKHPGKLEVGCTVKQYNYQALCQKRCGEILDCNHGCIGKCGQCYGGLVHKDCQQKCERLLVCGHKCRFPCSEQCQPCQEMCSNSCVHSKCQHKCFQECSPCKETCKSKCEHSACTKLCHEMCDREPCSLPCAKTIKKCGHPCIGICGETCPKLCRICNEKEVKEVFFGNEDEPEARFIELLDCKHIIEYSAMDQWMQSRYGDNSDEQTNQREKNTVQLPECPKCKTPIRKSFRYSNYIKQQKKNIDLIKLRMNANSSRDFIYQEATNIIKTCKEGYEEVLDEVEKSFSDISYPMLISLKNKVEITRTLINLQQKINKKLKTDSNQSEMLEYELRKLKKLMHEDKSKLGVLSKQKTEEVFNELKRIDALISYFQYLNEYTSKEAHYRQNKEKILKALAESEAVLFGKIKCFNQKVQNQTNNLFNSLKSMLETITQEERTMIHKAMGFSKGHWFKCPNGHIYCITECGGAMQESFCPECNCRIGGTNHTLLQNNTLASEMDGASFAAWSNTANNMGNWRFDD